MTQLYVYQPCREADLLLAQMWARMDTDGDLDNLFSNPHFSLGMLFEASAGPRHELLYAYDDQGIWIAFWFDPIMCGALTSAYVRPDARGSFRATITFKRILQSGLKAYGTLIGITRHESLLPVHIALGYTVAGRVPALFPGGRDGYLVVRVATEKEKARWHSSQPLVEQQAVPLAVPVVVPPGEPQARLVQRERPKVLREQAPLEREQQAQARRERARLARERVQPDQPPHPHSSPMQAAKPGAT